MAGAFALWSIAFYAAAIGFYLNAFGRTFPAILALVTCAAAFRGMFVVGGHRTAHS